MAFSSGLGAQPYLPAKGDSIDALRDAARSCQGCELFRGATQTVFGAGAPSARLVMIGEQPGDIEDRRGQPFVGPAGKLLDRAMARAGLDRADAYVTNVVKHFKFTPGARGTRRIHRTPDRTEIIACRPWLDAELALLQPQIIVTLGATASRALLGSSFRVTVSRGVLMPWPEAAGDAPAVDTPAVDTPAEHPLAAGVRLLATIHPSAVLRSDDRDAELDGFVADLRVAAGALV